jgi:hypothetical protein
MDVPSLHIQPRIQPIPAFPPDCRKKFRILYNCTSKAPTYLATATASKNHTYSTSMAYNYWRLASAPDNPRPPHAPEMNAAPPGAGGKGKQVHGRQPLLKSSSKLADLQNRLNFVDDLVQAFAQLLRDATDIQSPCPQLADRLPNLLRAFAHCQLAIQSQETLGFEDQLPWFVLKHRQLVHVRAPGWARQA